jgi:hypothetical protein
VLQQPEQSYHNLTRRSVSLGSAQSNGTVVTGGENPAGSAVPALAVELVRNLVRPFYARISDQKRLTLQGGVRYATSSAASRLPGAGLITR